MRGTARQTEDDATTDVRVERLLDLAPLNWNKTLQDQDTQQRLDANVFRRATLGLLGDHPPTK